MKGLTAAALVLALLPSTLQRCHDELYAQEDCRADYSRFSYSQRVCTDYYEMHCYEITNELKSDHMESVRRIIVKSGDIKSLTSALFDGFDNVISITMIGSNITDIQPYTFLHLSRLQSVNLTGNVLKVLPSRLFSSTSFTTLDLSNNNIGTIEYYPVFKPTELLLHHNQITDVSNLIAACTSLEILDLSYNNVKAIGLSDKCRNLLVLNVAHNELSEFMVTSSQPLKVNNLDLSCNRLKDISSSSLYNLVTLSNLNLNNNPLFYTKNPTVDLFQNTLQLQALNLSATGIQAIYVGTFSQLSSLKLLDLSQNNLTAFPKGIFHDLNNLTHLYLNNNRLTSFQYEGSAKLAKISLNANLFTCDTLVDIANTLTGKNVDIIRGYTRDTKNILGISCLDAKDDTGAAISQVNADKEYYKFFSKVEQMMQRLALEQQNGSLALIEQRHKSDIYRRNLTQDYKDFLQTLQQDLRDTLHKLTRAVTTSSEGADTATKFDNGNYSLEQWKLLRGNFTETLKSDRNEFLGAMRNSFDMLLSELRDINQHIEQANTPRNVSYAADPSSPRTSSLTNPNRDISVTNGSSKALIVGTYGIFLVLLVGLILLLISYFKYGRNNKIKHEECNSLNAMVA